MDQKLKGLPDREPDPIGNALLNLATQLLRERLPPDKGELPTNILNSAVQLAVIAMKAAQVSYLRC